MQVGVAAHGFEGRVFVDARSLCIDRPRNFAVKSCDDFAAVGVGDFKDRLERLGVGNEGGFAGQAGAFDFSMDGFRLHLGYGVDTAQGLLVAIQNGTGSLELPCLRPNLLRLDQHDASKQEISEPDPMHAR
ncbi:MAG: hypothetical protein WB683_03885 [Candidatus Sulfotelmatobacter sp.]